MYIDKRPKATGNIAGFINITQPGSTIKQPNHIFEGHERNSLFVCDIKSRAAWKQLLINYNLNRVDTNTVTMGVAHLTIYPIFY